MIKKLDTALQNLGLSADWFNELKSELEAEKLVTENGLLSTTDEDVTDELEQLDAEVEGVDEDDESNVDMNNISPVMQAVYKVRGKKMLIPFVVIGLCFVIVMGILTDLL